MLLGTHAKVIFNPAFMIRKSTFWLTMAFFLLFSCQSLADDLPKGSALESVKLQLKWFHQFQFAGYYAAKERGYFAEEGLDVEIRERDPNQDYLRQVVSGQADYGIGDSGIIAHYAKGEPIAALGAIFQHDALVLFSKQSSGIISPYEMRGKRIMYVFAGEDNAPIRALLAEANLTEADYSAIDQSFNVDDFMSDKVDVISGYLTDKPFEFQEKGIKVNVINPQNYGIDFYGDLLFTSRAELNQHPGRAERFRRAALKGWQYALDHPEEIIEIIRNQYHSRFSNELLRFEAAETRKLIMSDAVPLGKIEVGRMRRVAALYTHLKLAPPLSDNQLSEFIHSEKSLPTLSEQEKVWLEKHPLIKVGIDRDFAPYEWIDQQGNYVGMVAEHLRLIEQRLGVKFEIIKNKSWQEILDMAQRGELDMIAAAVKTPDREHYLNFTPAYVSTPAVIIGDESEGYIGTLYQLAGRRVAVEQGYFVQEMLSRDYPSIQLVPAASVKDALGLVAEGKVDAYVGDAASASYAIKQQGFLNLRFAGQTAYVSESRMAAVTSQPELVGILEKALTAIPQTERDAIINHWMGVRVQQGIAIETLVKYGIVALSALLLFAYWIYRLRREVKARKASEADLVMLYSNMSLGFALHEAIRAADRSIVDYRFLEINPAFEKMTGIPREKWIGKTAKQVLPDSKNNWIENFAAVDATGEPRYFESYAAEFDRWYVINSYKAAPERFVVLVQDITQRKKDELALKDSEARLRICQNYGGIGTWEFDLVNNQQIWSETFIAVLGFPSAKNPTWNDFLAMVHAEDRKLLIDAAQAHIEHGRKYDIEYRILTASGQIRWMRSVGQVERDADGKPLRMRGTIQEITERKIAEEKLRLSARVFSDTHEGIIITDANASILDVNPSFSEITGYSRDEVLGKNPGLLKSGRQNADFYSGMWQTLLESGHWQGEVWNRKKSGELYAELLTISALRDEIGKVINYVGLFSDITESKQQQQALEVLAHYDPLTQLPNRALFSDRFAQAMAHCKRSESLLAVCYLDLDGFKQVNDSFGHEVGDQLLIEVAKRIKVNLREGDTVCRLGGDEFALLFENLQSLQQCEDTLGRIHQTLSEPFELAERQVRIAASSGVTIYPLDKEEAGILLRHADQAMYQAKLAGRNCYRLYDHLQQHIQSQHQRFGRLEQALAEMDQALLLEQFCLYFQPKVNIKTGEVIGAEALIRWCHPERGLLPPAEFLPVIEGAALEVDVGNWVIKQAFQQLQTWLDVGLNLQISVNVTPKYLLWPGFIKMLERLLSEYPAISSRQLELEVLESSVLEDLISVGEVLKQCHSELGVLCALDDFGTGYSSLAHLRHLMINTVKIDQSFVRDMIDDPDDLAIVESVIGLAKAFKREVVAEGVETIDHGIFLIALGCHVAQGYGIARPMPASELLEWLETYKNQPAWDARGKAQPSAWQTQLELLQIQQRHWLQCMQTCLHAPSDANLHWPLIGRKRSHLGKWLARIKNQQSFDPRLFNRLEQFHSQQHQLAQQLIHSHQEGQYETARNGIKELLLINEEIVQLLQQFELFG
jgi:diguanylate cyclase (GGDEF)-like protein/PAS domain S-box-containing protein